MATVTASAPGKILLIGGYSILERPNVAYVLAVDAYVHAKVKTRKDDKIIISIPQFKTKIETTVNELDNQNKESAKFVLNAIKIALAYLKFQKKYFSGFEIITKSDKQFSVEGGKSGLGSSAAVTVATVAALLKTFDKTQDARLETTHKLSQYAHAISQGKVGSGFDIAAACFGSIQYARYSPERLYIGNQAELFKSELDCEIKPISLPSSLKLLVSSFPKESMSTTFSVSKVMEYKKNNSEEYAQLIAELNQANDGAIKSLNRGDLHAFQISFEEGRMSTKKLGELARVGIETDNHTRLIEESRQNGAFVCKLPGAGGGDSIVALCRNEQDKEKLKKFWKKKGLKILDVNVISEGVRYKER